MYISIKKCVNQSYTLTITLLLLSFYVSRPTIKQKTKIPVNLECVYTVIYIRKLN